MDSRIPYTRLFLASVLTAALASCVAPVTESSDSASQSVDHAPLANANGPYDGIVGQAITFSSSGSSDPDGDPLILSWSFGDGSAVATGTSPSHSYAAVGTYTVTLVATDSHGVSGTATASAKVVAPNRAPVAEINGPYVGTAVKPVLFSSVTSSDPEGDPLTFNWSFGDGATSVGSAPQHTFQAPGSYNVSLTVKDPAGATSQATTTVTIDAYVPGGFLYVLDPNSALLAVLAINHANGSLFLASPPAAFELPADFRTRSGAALSRDHRFLFLMFTNGSNSKMRVFALDSNGGAAEVAAARLDVSGGSGGLLQAHPTLSLLYAFTSNGLNIIRYDANTGIPQITLSDASAAQDVMDFRLWRDGTKAAEMVGSNSFLVNYRVLDIDPVSGAVSNPRGGPFPGVPGVFASLLSPLVIPEPPYVALQTLRHFGDGESSGTSLQTYQVDPATFLPSASHSALIAGYNGDAFVGSRIYGIVSSRNYGRVLLVMLITNLYYDVNKPGLVFTSICNVYQMSLDSTTGQVGPLEGTDLGSCVVPGGATWADEERYLYTTDYAAKILGARTDGASPQRIGPRAPLFDFGENVIGRPLIVATGKPQ